MPSPSISRLLAFILLLTAMQACKKGSSSPDDGTLAAYVTNGQPAATTPVGTPVGSPVSKVIGSAGGVLYSPDNLLQLTITAGALPVNTNISIQPVTNTMPGGIGLAYDLLPNGTKFAVPVTVTFHYSPDSVDNSMPYFLNIAYQDANHVWQTDMQNRYFDTAAHTLSLDVSHFTVYGYDDGIGLAASPKMIYAGQTSSLFPYESLQQAPNDDGDIITETTGIPAQFIGQWFVNDIPGGNASIGTISGGSGGQPAVYHAPANLDHTITVFVACQLKVTETFTVKKSKTIIKNPKKGVSITVKPYGEYDFTVSLYYADSTISGFYGDLPSTSVPVYNDHCQFDMHLKAKPGKAEITYSNIQNFAPSVTSSYAAYSVFTWTWISDPYGVIDVSSVYFAPGDETAFDSVYEVSLRHANAAGPGEKTTASGTVVYDYAAQPFGNGIGLPPIFPLDLKRKPPYLDYVVKGGGRYEIYAIVPK